MIQNPDPLLRPPAAAAYIGAKSAQALAEARCTGTGAYADLEFIKAGTRIFYRRSQLDRWLDAHTVRPAALREA